MKTKTRMIQRINIINLVVVSVLLAMPLADGQTQAGPKEPKAPSSFPSCTDNLSSVSMPRAPHGQFVILFPA
jgi:hypothetical protein